MGSWNRETITNFVHSWYSRLNDHAPLEEISAMLSPDGFELLFPEATVNSRAQFEAWYRGVTGRFFDQCHTVQELKVEIAGDDAVISVTVNWRAHSWQPPQPYSTWINAVAEQKWQIVKNPVTGNPQIKRYLVESFKPVA